MQGARKEIPKEETYNTIQIRRRGEENWNWVSWGHGSFIRPLSRKFRNGRSLIEGRFAYTMGDTSTSTDHKRTCPYVGENRKLDSVFCVKGPREFAGADTSSPTAQLQSIRLCLAVIAYQKWNFRVMDVPMASLNLEPLQRDTYAQLPQG